MIVTPQNALTQAQVRTLLLSVGFVGRGARIGSAIALCESPVFGGLEPMSDFGAIGDQDLADATWGYSYGGFQIRSLRAQKGTGGPRDEDRLLEPQFNAKSARIIKLEQGWAAWSTYTSGAYKAYLPDLFPPAPGTYVVQSGDTLTGIAAKLGGFTWEQLASANGLNAPYSIFIGQVLLLPVP